MKFTRLLIISLIFIFSVSLTAQDKPSVNFEDLTISAEMNFQNVIDARNLAASQNLPHTIYMPEGIFIEAKGIENNRVVYSVIHDLRNIYNGGETAFWEEIASNYDLSVARMHWTNRPTQNPSLGYSVTPQNNTMAANFLMVMESTNDALMTFNADDGSLINAAYFPGGDPNLSTPIEALLTPNATVVVSDQITDQIVEYDTVGTFIRILFGNDLTVLDNCRGIALTPGMNSVVATIGGGTNDDAVPEFDLATGSYLGNFIAPNSTLLNSPFDIIFRNSDCLVSGSSSDNIARYDLSGNYIGDLVSGLNFPEQIYKAPNGNILAAGFSTPSGLYIYDSNGIQLNFFGAVTGLRGVYQLGNGNYLVTNGTSVSVLDQNTGAVLSTPVSGVSGRFISEYDRSIIPVELTSFSANVVDGKVHLNWTTATETNNKGFEVQRADGAGYQTIGFVPGNGTTTEQHLYSYIDYGVENGNYNYRLKQVDFNGASEYSQVIEIFVDMPLEYNLSQNYPNPFNPSTQISFTIKVTSRVTLKIFDVLGREVVNLMNKNIAAGSHTINFDASDLNSGVYLYRIEAAGTDGSSFRSVKKMILTK